MSGDDLRLYRKSSAYADNGNYVSEIMDSSPVDFPPATDIEVLANKVVKYMLTTKGSDPTDSRYGSFLTTYTHISKEYVPRIYIEILNDLKSCLTYIQKHSSESKLANIVFKNLNYSPEVDPTKMAIFIEIVMTDGRRALLTIPNWKK